MNTTYLTQADIVEFEKRFSAAAAWITERNLIGEHRHLLTKPALLTDWELRRLAELNNWAESINEIRSSRAANADDDPSEEPLGVEPDPSEYRIVSTGGS